MKTAVFNLLLTRLAKATMEPAAYEDLVQRMRFWKWNQYRQHFPELWDHYSDRFEAVKAQLSGSPTPEGVLDRIVPGPIERHPQIFEAFEREIADVRVGLPIPDDPLETPAEPRVTEAPADDDHGIFHQMGEVLKFFGGLLQALGGNPS